jgi:two-component system, cell cycle response regulator DivK
MSAKKILVVEDDRPSAAILAYKLKASGYAVVVAPDCASAVTMARAEKPDLMILDLGLPSKDPFSGPNWDGFGVIDWLHRTQPDEAIPTIVVTAWSPVKAKQRALDAGAIAYFQKPVPYKDLLVTIGNVLGASSAPTESPGQTP